MTVDEVIKPTAAVSTTDSESDAIERTAVDLKKRRAQLQIKRAQERTRRAQQAVIEQDNATNS